MSRTAITSLVTDVGAALDGALELAERIRLALLSPYASWPDDTEPTALGDGDGTPSPGRTARVLGAPFPCGGHEIFDPLPDLIARLGGAGGSTAPLQRVVRAVGDLGHLLRSYEQGLYTGMTVATWRTEVTRRYDRAETCILDAKREIEAWEHAETSAPNAHSLTGKELVFPEDVAETLGVGIDAARKHLSSGRYGTPVRFGKRVAVLKDDLYAALRAQAASAPDRPPSSTPVPPVPRRRQRAGPAE